MREGAGARCELGLEVGEGWDGGVDDALLLRLGDGFAGAGLRHRLQLRPDRVPARDCGCERGKRSEVAVGGCDLCRELDDLVGADGLPFRDELVDRGLPVRVELLEVDGGARFDLGRVAP